MRGSMAHPFYASWWVSASGYFGVRGWLSRGGRL